MKLYEFVKNLGSTYTITKSEEQAMNELMLVVANEKQRKSIYDKIFNDEYQQA